MGKSRKSGRQNPPGHTGGTPDQTGHPPAERRLPGRKKRGGRGDKAPGKRRAAGEKTPLIWGIHAVAAALANKARPVNELYLTANAAQRLSDILSSPLPDYVEASPKDIARRLGPEPVHQGALLVSEPLAMKGLEELDGSECVVVLDQVTDPHNVGAILRSAAAFGVAGLIMTQRNSPPLSGTLAKTASGGLEHVNVMLVGNLSQALEKLGDLGFERIGFDGEGEEVMEQQQRQPGRGVALVFGAEEKGLRRLTRERCDMLCRIHAGGAFASLNVSNAAAIAFHHFQALSDQS